MPPPSHAAYLSLNSGEVTPLLWYRTDFAKHASSCADMTNFLPLPFGGARKRPGTLYLNSLGTAPVRLHPMRVFGGEFYTPISPSPGGPPFPVGGTLYEEPEDGRAFILAFSATQLKIYTMQGVLFDTKALVTAAPFKLQFSQANNVLFITGPDIHPQRLVGDVTTDTFTLEELPWKFPPLLEENDVESLTVAVSQTYGGLTWTSGVAYTIGQKVNVAGVGDYDVIANHTAAANNKPETGAFWALNWRASIDNATPTGSSLTLTFSSAYKLDVGQIIRVSEKRAANGYEVEIAATSANNGLSSAPIVVWGEWNFRTFGTWEGTFTLQRSTDQGATWTDFRSYKAEKNRNVDVSDVEDSRVLLRVKWTYVGPGTSDPKGVISSADAFMPGLAKVTGVTSSTVYTATTLSPIEKGTTQYWTPGAYSVTNGYPRAVTLHERRLILGGTGRYPHYLWFSKSDDLLNFRTGTDADDGILEVMTGAATEPIVWMQSMKRLFIGTEGGEWVFGSETNDATLTPENLTYRQYTHYGSAYIPSIPHHDALFFIERQGRRLRELAYQLDRESYSAADLTRLAEHITGTGIVQMDWQQNKEPYLWAIRADGVALSFLYNRDEQLAAWSKHTTYNGTFSSIAIIRSTERDDAVFFAVKRGSTYYLEKLAPLQTGPTTYPHHVDCGVVGEISPTLPAPCRGLTLPIFRNGTIGTAVCHPSTGALSSITVSVGGFSDEFHVGLPITCRITTVPLNVNSDNGPTHFRRKRANEIVVNKLEGYPFTLTYAGQEVTAALIDGETYAPTYTGATLYTHELTLPQGHLNDLAFSLSSSDAAPCTLRAIILRWDLHES
jgi:hypothetical protein